MRPWVLMDFETANPDTALLKDGGAWRYSEDVCTEILCLLFTYRQSAPFVWTPDYREHEEYLRDLAGDPAVIFKRHGDFELAIWRNIMRDQYNFPDKPLECWHDTMACAAVKALPLALEHLCPAINLGVNKDMEGRKHTLGLSKPNKRGYFDRSGAAIQRVIDYCAIDIETELAADERLGPMPDDEHAAWLLHQKMNAQGLRIDLDYVAKCQEIVDKASVPLVARFRELTGLNPTQVQKVKQWCHDNGAELPNLAAETVAAALGGSVDEEDAETDVDIRVTLPANVRAALEIRQLIGSASVKKLRRMAACVCADGRARGLSQYHGAGPGRSTGRLFQPYNFPRGTLKLDGEAPPPHIVVDAIMTGDPDYVSMVLGPPIQTVVSGLRHAIVPDIRHVFLSGDYAGIQARIVLALAGEHEKTALMRDGADVYCDMASKIYKRPIDKKRDPAERQVGKNAVLGLGFGMGWKKFKAKYGKHLSDEFCQMVVWTYRGNKNRNIPGWAPGVPQLWKMADLACRAAFPNSKVYGVSDVAIDFWARRGITFTREEQDNQVWLSIKLPSGRRLWYHDADLTNEDRWKVYLPNDTVAWYKFEEDIPKDELLFARENVWQEVIYYESTKNGRVFEQYLTGATITENVVMGIEVDIQRHGWKTAEAAGFPIVHECYDELVAEVPAKGADLKGFLQCLLDPPDWLPALKIPVAVEGWHGDRYRK